MARIAKGILYSVLTVLLAAGMTACGVKSPPLPATDVAPPKVEDLSARAVPGAIEVSFTVPQADSPSQRVTEIRLFYGYLPLTGDPECPPCPPRLRKYHQFDMEGGAPQLMKGGRFVYLDKAAPVGKEAAYQVVLEDARGRDSLASNLARAPRLEPPAMVSGLMIVEADDSITLNWDGPMVPEKGVGPGDIAGYVVYRKGPDGEKKLNLRPLREPTLVDKTVVAGKGYAYKVAAVKQAQQDVFVEGESTEWSDAKPLDTAAPGAPSDLMGISQAEGIMLRYTPSPDVDTRGYRIFRSLSKDGDWEEITEKAVIENTFLDNGVEERKVYFYKVMAVDEAGNESEFSEVIEIEYTP